MSFILNFLLFFSRVYPDRESLVTGALNLASQIAKKSPVAVSGTKQNLNFSRDHSVDEGLDYVVCREYMIPPDSLKERDSGFSSKLLCFFILYISCVERQAFQKVKGMRQMYGRGAT